MVKLYVLLVRKKYLTICIYYNKNIIYFNTFYDHLFYSQNTLSTPSPNAEFTRRLYSVHTARSQRAHGALEDPIALPQRCHSVLSITLWKRQAAAFV